MTGFRLVYRRGSFAFAIACASLEQALARAVSVSREAGVWHVQVEDESGRPVALTSGGIAMHRRSVTVFPLVQSATGLRKSRSPEVKRSTDHLPE